MSRTMRTLAALALAVLFLSSAVPAAAAPPGQAGPASLWSSAWQWLAGLFITDESRGTIDPNGGRPRPGPVSNSDAGGGIDPDGLVVTGAQLAPRREASPDGR